MLISKFTIEIQLPSNGGVEIGIDICLVDLTELHIGPDHLHAYGFCVQVKTTHQL